MQAVGEHMRNYADDQLRGRLFKQMFHSLHVSAFGVPHFANQIAPWGTGVCALGAGCTGQRFFIRKRCCTVAQHDKHLQTVCV